MSLSKKKRIALRIAAVPVALTDALGAVTAAVMHWQFSRGDYPDPAETTHFWYDPYYIDRYPRENVQFRSGENTLQGYLYGLENPDPPGLIVFAHGIGTGHESYINQLLWLVDQGWRVFAYDATGSGTSEGSGTVGLVQSALDLDCALSYAETDERLNTLPVFLLGHSWGGFAVCGVLHFGHDITAVCSVSGYAYPQEMTDRGGDLIMGNVLGKAFYPFTRGYNRLTFGENTGLNAVDAINEAGVPVLVVHGALDDFVDYKTVSILSKQPQITAPDVEYFPITGVNGTHEDVFSTPAAAVYLQDFKKNRDKKHLVERCAAADKALANEVNTELMEKIDGFYRKYLE